jgi:hypothetical protein
MEPHGEALGTSISSAKSAEALSHTQDSRLPKNLFGEQVGRLSFLHSSADKTMGILHRRIKGWLEFVNY